MYEIITELYCKQVICTTRVRRGGSLSGETRSGDIYNEARLSGFIYSN